jgi:hypothetical protein
MRRLIVSGLVAVCVPLCIGPVANGRTFIKVGGWAPGTYFGPNSSYIPSLNIDSRGHQATSGASSWVNNTHYLLLRLTGTFTPTGGTPHTFTKVYGHKSGFGQTYTCTGSQTQPTGIFSFTATIARTPSH